MKSGVNTQILKITENKNKKKKTSQSFSIQPFSLSQVKSSFTDVMKIPAKKRVPFDEILNQQEVDLKSLKTFKKSSKGLISDQTSENDVSFQKKNQKQNFKKQKTEIPTQKANKSDKFTQQGENSIQLISVVQSVTISSRSNEKKSAQICNQRSYYLQINEQAVKKLLELNSQEDIGFCTAVGKTKTGKSFLLNKLINLQKRQQIQTFSVNHTLASCTKGLWISKQPIKASQKSIIILDAAGLGSYDSTQEIDFKLMTLSILLSDVLMYNSVGPIDQQMLNGMSLAVQISKMLNQQQSKTKNIDKILTFPSLFWILRDFSLELLTKENKKIKEEQYLEKCLSTENKNNSTLTNKTRNKVNIRQAIKSLFEERKCSTLVMPFDQEGKIRNQFYDGLFKVKGKLFSLMNCGQKTKQKKKNVNKVQDFILKLRVFVELLNNSDSQSLKSDKKGSFLFPKIQSLESNLNRAKLLHEFKKINDQYDKLFRKYEQNIEKVQQAVDSKDKYLKKAEKLRQKMQSQINLAMSQFNEKIQSILNLKTSLKIPNFLQNQSFSNKNQTNATKFKIDMLQLQKDYQTNNNLLKVVKQNYQIQCNTLRLRFQQIEEKIQKSSQSYRSNQNEDQERILRASKIVNQSSESFREINSLTELKKAFQKTLKDLKNLFRESQELKELKKLEKQLEVHYLNKKVNLMEESNLQSSNQSHFAQLSNLKTQGYESCTNCEKSFYIPYFIIPSSDLLRIKFLKTIVKEMHHEFLQQPEKGKESQIFLNDFCPVKKMKLQFIIQVELNNKKWFIRRKLKDFMELNNIISVMFSQEEDNMVYPTVQKIDSDNKNLHLMSMLKLSNLNISNDYCQEKVRKIKQQLYSFLLKLNSLDYVRNSRIFQKFVKINKEYLDL